MRLPSAIREIVQAQPYTQDTIGMSGAAILLYSDMVLKIQPESTASHRELAAMRWLSDKLPVPKILHAEESEETSYLLMSRLPGTMTCDASMLRRPKETVDCLAQGLKLLWQVDITGCPSPNILDDKLLEAEYRVANGLCDTQNVEPGTYGPGGFSSPAALLSWLKENRPQESPVFSHGDYCLPNIFVKDLKISGFLDLGRSGISDPYQDIALCYRSLRCNFQNDPTFRPESLFEALELTPDWSRIRYYILLDELF